MPHQVIGVAWMVGKEKGTNKGGIMSDEVRHFPYEVYDNLFHISVNTRWDSER